MILNLSSDYLRADAGINSLRGVGASEAPRGTLFHDYTVDRDGLLKRSISSSPPARTTWR